MINYEWNRELFENVSKMYSDKYISYDQKRKKYIVRNSKQKKQWAYYDTIDQARIGKEIAIEENWTYNYKKYITKKNEEYYLDLTKKPYIDILEKYSDEEIAKKELEKALKYSFVK